MLERAIDAIWRSHGDAVVHLRTLREDHRQTHGDFVDCGNPHNPDSTPF